MFVPSCFASANNFRRFYLLSSTNIYCENMTKDVLQVFAFSIGGNFNGLAVVGDHVVNFV